MNRELTKLKAELRILQDSLKKTEKDRYDTKKTLESKENALEKLRKERDELSAIVNTDKYKNLRTAEIERQKVEKEKVDLETVIIRLKEEHERESERVKDLEGRI
jgi:chromosome segregation ATPase